MCPHWTHVREEAAQLVGRAITLEDVPDILLGIDHRLLLDEPNQRKNLLTLADTRLKAFCSMVSCIMRRKEEEEHARQALGLIGHLPL